MNKTLKNQKEYDQLSTYTQSHKSPSFIHQHIVDAFYAQTANEETKNISLIFSLVGLYLYIEKNYTGLAIQKAHMNLAKARKNWPKLDLPNFRGKITGKDISLAKTIEEYNKLVNKWAIEVYKTWEKYHKLISNISRDFIKKENLL